MVHIVNYSPVRRTPKHTDFHDDPIPLTNLTVRINLPLRVSTATALYAGQELPVRRVPAAAWKSSFPEWIFTRWCVSNCPDLQTS